MSMLNFRNIERCFKYETSLIVKKDKRDEMRQDVLTMEFEQLVEKYMPYILSIRTDANVAIQFPDIVKRYLHDRSVLQKFIHRNGRCAVGGYISYMDESRVVINVKTYWHKNDGIEFDRNIGQMICRKKAYKVYCNLMKRLGKYILLHVIFGDIHEIEKMIECCTKSENSIAEFLHTKFSQKG